jgi:hypothetical protein
MVEKFPRVKLTISELKDFLMTHRGMIEKSVMIMFNGQSKDIRSH